MIYAVDWAHLQRNEYIVNSRGRQVKSLNLKKGDKILVETGCPKIKLYKYLKAEVLQVDSKETHKIVKKKSHKNDALALLKLYKKKPNLFKGITKLDKEEIELRKQLRTYERITKVLAGIKSIQKAQVREFGEENEEIKNQIKALEQKKKETLKPIEKWIKPYLKKVEDIKGIGARLLGAILIMAHPKNFPCLSAYLSYCGFKGIAKETNKYNRNVKTCYYLIVDGIVKNKNRSASKFCKMYGEFKKNIAKQHKDWTKGKIDGVTRNRIATFVAKEIYGRFGKRGGKTVK